MEMPINKKVVVLIFFAAFLGSGCTKKPALVAIKKPDDEMLHVEAIRRSVTDYLNQSPVIDADLKQALTTLAQSTGKKDIGEWVYSEEKNILYNHGYQIGDEHTWYEVKLSTLSNRVTVIKAIKQRERIQ